MIALVAGGVGVIGLGLGAVFGALTFSQYSNSKNECTTPVSCGQNTPAQTDKNSCVHIGDDLGHRLHRWGRPRCRCGGPLVHRPVGSSDASDTIGGSTRRRSYTSRDVLMMRSLGNSLPLVVTALATFAGALLFGLCAACRGRADLTGRAAGEADGGSGGGGSRLWKQQSGSSSGSSFPGRQLGK